MATKARTGFATKIYRGKGDSPETFDLVPEVIGAIKLPEYVGDVVEVTNHDSPNGWAEFIPTGTKAAGEVSFTVNFLQDDAVQRQLMSDAANPVVRNYRAVLPTGTVRFAFAGILKMAGGAADVKDSLKRDFAITITGQPYYENHP